MQSGHPSFYLVPPEQLLALQKIGKTNIPPSYDELVAKVSKIISEIGTLQRQV